MSDFKLHARVQFTPRASSGQFVSRVAAGGVNGVNSSLRMLFDLSQSRVAVKTGELKGSGAIIEATDKGGMATGSVVYTAGHAGYVEFGTGIRGSSSSGASSKVSYSPTWPGMPAQSYLRSSADELRQAIKAQMRQDLSVSIRTK